MISYEGRNARTVNQLKVIQFDHPEWTPCGVGLYGAGRAVTPPAVVGR